MGFKDDIIRVLTSKLGPQVGAEIDEHYDPKDFQGIYDIAMHMLSGLFGSAVAKKQLHEILAKHRLLKLEGK